DTMENTKNKYHINKLQENSDMEEFTKDKPENFLFPLKPQFMRVYIITLLRTLIICIVSFIRLRVAG
ncbi:MAG: hypothetical protein RR770_01830, partial [Bacteroidales bacterium]